MKIKPGAMRFGLSLCSISNDAVFFLHGCVTYFAEYQRDNYLCLLRKEAGIDGYVIEG